MRKDITVIAEPRPSRGKNEANRLRARGLNPAVLYGSGSDPVAVAINPREVVKILQSSTGHNTIFNLTVQGGETSPVMITDWQRDPLKGSLLHVDFQRIDLSKPIRVKVPVHTVGEPRGVKVQGGQLDVVNREVEIECLPDSIPEFFERNIADLMIGQGVRASDLPLGEGMRLVSDPNLVLSHVVATRNSDLAAGAEAGAAEPEVMKKGKTDKEGDDKDKPKK